MRSLLIITLCAILFSINAAAYPYFFPFDTLNTPDETLRMTPIGLYFTSGVYYLNDTGEYYDDAGNTRDYSKQDWWYVFIPFGFGYSFLPGFEAGVQATVVSNETAAGSTGGLGDFWLKARYSFPLSERFYIGGRLAGKFFNLHEYSIPAVSERANSFDITLFGGARIAGPLLTEYSVGYRLVGNMNDPGGAFENGDIGNDFRVMAAPRFALAGGAFNITVPISYLSTSATVPAYPDEGYVTINYYGCTLGFNTICYFAGNIISKITIGGEFTLKGRNIPKNYYIGGAYSAVLPL